jgi:HSP20 family molecular chaperone IbpA
MWEQALDLWERADRLHRQFFQLTSTQARRPNWEPPVDIYETERELSIIVALPGVAPDQLEVVIDAATLLVLGERPMPVTSRDAVIHRLEIPYGRFERRIELPPGSYRIGQRMLVDGCLTLILHKPG